MRYNHSHKGSTINTNFSTFSLIVLENHHDLCLLPLTCPQSYPSWFAGTVYHLVGSVGWAAEKAHALVLQPLSFQEGYPRQRSYSQRMQCQDELPSPCWCFQMFLLTSPSLWPPMLPCAQDQENPGLLAGFVWQVRENLGCWLQEYLQHIKRLQKEK